jgi:plastocyanin
MPPPRASRKRAAALALAGALALSGPGCADDTPPAKARARVVDVTLDDFLIRPQRVRARAGRLTFRVVNRGRVGHTLHVLHGETDELAVKTMLPRAGASASVTLVRGDYELVCVLGNHEELGMYGTLIVR